MHLLLLQQDHMSRRLHSSSRLGLASTYVCSTCRVKRFPTDLPSLHGQKRWITRNHIRKIQEAEKDWSLRANAIVSGKVQSMLNLLEERGYVNQIVGYLRTLLTRVDGS